MAIPRADVQCAPAPQQNESGRQPKAKSHARAGNDSAAGDWRNASPSLTIHRNKPMINHKV